MRHLPKVLIATATQGNRNKFLQETITSVLLQSYSNYRLLIIDNSQAKKSFPLVKEFMKKDKRIFYAHHPEIQLPAYSRNKALDYLSKDFELIKWLDDDDLFYDKNSLECLVAPFTNKKVIMVYGIQEYIDAQGNHLKFSLAHPYHKFYILSASSFPCTTALFKAEVIKKLKGFALMKSSEDIDLILRFFEYAQKEKKQIVFVKKKVAKYRKHQNGIGFLNHKNGEKNNAKLYLMIKHTNNFWMEFLPLYLYSNFRSACKKIQNTLIRPNDLLLKEVKTFY